MKGEGVDSAIPSYFVLIIARERLFQSKVTCKKITVPKNRLKNIAYKGQIPDRLTFYAKPVLIKNSVQCCPPIIE